MFNWVNTNCFLLVRENSYCRLGAYKLLSSLLFLPMGFKCQDRRALGS